MLCSTGPCSMTRGGRAVFAGDFGGEGRGHNVGSGVHTRHCERSEAIHLAAERKNQLLASLAMTIKNSCGLSLRNLSRSLQLQPFFFGGSSSFCAVVSAPKR